MNEIINFRCEGEVVVMALNEEVEFQVLISSIKERLTLFKERSSEAPSRIRIDLGHRKIKPAELLELFDVIVNEKVILIDGITSLYKDVEDAVIFEGTIRGGQIKFFEQSTMITGDINPAATVYCADNLYVVGEIRGKVIAKNKTSLISASSFKNCLVQIYNSEPIFIEKLNNCILSYELGVIKIEENIIKGEKSNGKNHRHHVR